MRCAAGLHLRHTARIMVRALAAGAGYSSKAVLPQRLQLADGDPISVDDIALLEDVAQHLA